MSRRPISVALVVSGLLGGCSGPNAPAETADTEVASLQQRAEQGDADAQYNLGVLYEAGEGIPRDYAEAAWWYLKAAEQGNANAQFAIGAMYRMGEGLPKDSGRGVVWTRKAAEQGDAYAQGSLASSYYLGEGVIQDDVEALKWYIVERTTLELETPRVTDETQELSTKLKGLRALDIEFSKGFADLLRAELEAQMTPQQIAEAQISAWKWQAAFDARQE